MTRIVTVDREMKTVTVDGVVHRPSRIPFAFLDILISRPGVMRSREQLMDHADMDVDVSDRAVDVHMKRLRQQGFREITTRYSFGYYWHP